MVHARPIRLRARGRASVAAAAASLLVLSACGGEPGAQETIGPTAGTSTSADQTYEPTLPPYTSDVDLTPDEEKDVEELLLLIDEFNILTSTLSDQSIERAEKLHESVDEELLEWHLSDMKTTMEDGVRTRGVIIPNAAKVLSFDAPDATVSICYRFDD